MSLSFELVDDLAFASQSGNARLDSFLASATLDALGPMIEYSWHRRSMALPSLAIAQATPLSQSFLDFVSGPKRGVGSLNDGRTTDFIRVPASIEGFASPAWIAFQSRMKFAAEKHGFGRQQAAGVVGALAEMASNAFEHSHRPESAIAAYHSNSSAFEFCIADAGIGAIASLRLGDEFQHIHDTGEALKLCISDGVSRFGRDALRGAGFGQLFSRLTDLRARVRIRSDDQVIDLRGDVPGQASAFPAGRTPVRGFLVSAQCFSRPGS